SALPDVPQPEAAGAAEIDLVEAAGDGIEAGGIDDDVEFEFLVAGLDAGGRDALDRRLRDVDQLDIVAIVDLVIEGLELQGPCAEAVVLRNELFGDPLVLDALADLAGDELADRGVRLAIDQYVAEVALPDAEAALAIELFVKRLALRIGDLERAARVGRMDEA